MISRFTRLFVFLFALFLTNPAYSKDINSVGTVTKVFDGDSFLVKSGRRTIEVRMDSVDAPEHSQSYGQYCKRGLEAKILNREIRFRQTDTDRYGRFVAVVYLENRNINREIVGDGCAWAYRKYLRDNQLVALEQQARRNRKALWSDKKPIPPWLYRRGN